MTLAGCTWDRAPDWDLWSGDNKIIHNEQQSAFRFSKIFETNADEFLGWIREVENIYDEINAPAEIKEIADKTDNSWYEREHPDNPEIVFSVKKDFWDDYYNITTYVDRYILEKNGEQILELPREFILTEPLKNFVVNEEWWWLLYHKIDHYSDEEAQAIFDQTWKYPEQPRTETPILIHNGKEIRYNEIFGLHNFWGKIFYFFREKSDSPLQYFYDGKTYKTGLKNVIHNTCGCNEEDVLDMKADEEKGKMILWDRNGENLELWLMEVKGESKHITE